MPTRASCAPQGCNYFRSCGIASRRRNFGPSDQSASFSRRGINRRISPPTGRRLVRDRGVIPEASVTSPPCPIRGVTNCPGCTFVTKCQISTPISFTEVETCCASKRWRNEPRPIVRWLTKPSMRDYDLSLQSERSGMRLRCGQSNTQRLRDAALANAFGRAGRERLGGAVFGPDERH